MSVYSDRVNRVLAVKGEPLSFGTYGGVLGVVIVRSVVAMAGSGDINAYLDDVEKMGVTYPALKLTLAGDSLLAVSDAFTRDSRSFSIFKVFKHRIGSEVVGVTAIAC